MNNNISERVITFYKQLIEKTAPTPMVLTYVCFEDGRPRHRCQVACHTEGLLVRPLHCLHQPFREPDLQWCSGCKEDLCKWTLWHTPRAWCGPAFKHPIGHQDHTWTKAHVSMDGCLRGAICHLQKSRAWAKVRQVGWEVFVGLSMAEQIGTYGTCKDGVA